MATEYQMPRRGERCCTCERRFEIGDTIQACLYETPAGYERRDYCATCEPPNEPCLALWRTRRPAPSTPPRTPFDREAILAFFRRLDDAETPAKLQLRFVLALLLWRKKVLAFESSSADAGGVETWHFTLPKSDVAYDVRRPDLDEDRIEQLSAQLEALLTGDQADLSAADPMAPAETSDG